jgi:hypothetical protein
LGSGSGDSGSSRGHGSSPRSTPRDSRSNR